MREITFFLRNSLYSGFKDDVDEALIQTDPGPCGSDVGVAGQTMKERGLMRKDGDQYLVKRFLSPLFKPSTYLCLSPTVSTGPSLYALAKQNFLPSSTTKRIRSQKIFSP